MHKVLIDWGKQRDYLDCIQNGRAAMAFMAEELRQASNVDDQHSNTALRFDPPAGTRVWYWVGNRDDDSASRGDRTFLYRGTGNSVNNAYNTRRELANFVADNPGGEDQFDFSSNVATIILTFMPEPDAPAGPGNRAFTLRIKVRPRN